MAVLQGKGVKPHRVAKGATPWQIVKFNGLRPQKTKGSSNTTNHIKNQKALPSPDIFQYIPEHPQGKHIEEDMANAGMHKHTCYNLIGPKQIRLPVMEGKKSSQLVVKNFFTGHLDQKNQDIDDQQIFDYRW